MQYVALEELLVKVEVFCAHCLVENKIAQHCTHVLSSTSTLMPLVILYQIDKALFSQTVLFVIIQNLIIPLDLFNRMCREEVLYCSVWVKVVIYLFCLVKKGKMYMNCTL
jgi:hypothetical protein